MISQLILVLKATLTIYNSVYRHKVSVSVVQQVLAYALRSMHGT